MDLRAVLNEVSTWAPEDRLRLIGEVWNGLSDEEHAPELPEELKDLLSRRLEAIEANPDDVMTWEEITAYVRRPR